ncbi:Cytochrome c heme lyase subunit CcmL [Vibrio casei]|uniref:Cytochrome c-type biogenesis protein n=2 Tax=Vibrio casei TaxID=673372 RepID=A0A368LNY8_9VIBR|nr:cytochrome c-type biogenesis protein CcmH [Vibrio casei]SJN16819.1 Cytochrome c heme lyase subunit CcmL [Vibrio casei]
MMKPSAILLGFLMVIAVPVMAAIEVFDFDSPQQEAQFQELSHTLRCPKCQNNSISDSNAELAKDLRLKVYQMTKAGKSKQEIVDYMVARYGNFVTYNPPLTVSTAVLWVAPISIVLFGFGFIVIRSRRSSASKTVSSEMLDENQEQRLKELLEEASSGSNEKKDTDS